MAGEGSDGLGAGGAVDVQDVEPVAGGQADVGLGLLGPPGQHPGPVGRRLLEPVGHQAAEGVLGDLAAARIPTRAARAHRGVRQLSVVGDGLDAAVVGEGVVQGQHRDAPGGIAEGGVAQQPAGPAHGVRSCSRWALALQEGWRRCCGRSRRPRPGCGPSRAGRPAAAGHRPPAAAPRPCCGRSGWARRAALAAGSRPPRPRCPGGPWCRCVGRSCPAEAGRAARARSRGPGLRPGRSGG